MGDPRANREEVKYREAKGKGKAPPGCTSTELWIKATGYSMPYGASHSLSSAQLLLTPPIIRLRCAKFNVQT